MNNIELKQLESKYYFIGFIIGLTPFIFLILLTTLLESNFNHVKIIFLVGLTTAITNGIILKSKIKKVIK